MKLTFGETIDRPLLAELEIIVEKAGKWDLLQQSLHELTGNEKKITLGQTFVKLMDEKQQLKEEREKLLTDGIKFQMLISKQHQQLERIRYRVNQFRVKDGMIQDKFGYYTLKEILETKEELG